MKTSLSFALCLIVAACVSASCSQSRVMIGDNGGDAGTDASTNTDAETLTDGSMSADSSVVPDGGLCSDCCTPFLQGPDCADTNRGPCVYATGCGMDPSVMGHCPIIASECPADVSPVCGCDGVTYSNECRAQQAGASVWYAGECGTACGGIAEIGCPIPEEFCDFNSPGTSSACGGDDSMGTCRMRPSGCVAEGAGVCGCNGTNYASACDANQAGVSVANYGPCTPAVTCGVQVTPVSGLVTTERGGTATFTVVLTCGPTLDVSIELSSSDSSEGSVAPSAVTFTPADWAIPQTVTVTGVDDDASDGDTSFNIVMPAIASADPSWSGIDPHDVAVLNLDDEGTPCGEEGIGPSCGPTEYCAYFDGALCGRTEMGVCKARPVACTGVLSNVCACNGGDFANACVARMAGHDAAFEGPCPH